MVLYLKKGRVRPIMFGVKCSFKIKKGEKMELKNTISMFINKFGFGGTWPIFKDNPLPLTLRVFLFMYYKDPQEKSEVWLTISKICQDDIRLWLQVRNYLLEKKVFYWRGSERFLKVVFTEIRGRLISAKTFEEKMLVWRDYDRNLFQSDVLDTDSRLDLLREVWINLEKDVQLEYGEIFRERFMAKVQSFEGLFVFLYGDDSHRNDSYKRLEVFFPQLYDRFFPEIRNFRNALSCFDLCTSSEQKEQVVEEMVSHCNTLWDAEQGFKLTKKTFFAEILVERSHSSEEILSLIHMDIVIPREKIGQLLETPLGFYGYKAIYREYPSEKVLNLLAESAVREHSEVDLYEFASDIKDEKLKQVAMEKNLLKEIRSWVTT